MAKQRPSLTSLKELLRQSAFDPRADGPFAIVVDVATANPRYAEDKAKELIAQAQACLDRKTLNPAEATKNLSNYHDFMQQAIGLLALARALRE